MPASTPANPHFDEGVLIWSDDFSGRYPPPGDYSAQFDEKWKLVLEDASGSDFNAGPGVRLDEASIAALAYEWTGSSAHGAPLSDGRPPKLDRFVDPSLIDGKRCIDIGCGMGRWTKVMQHLGAAEVLSVDAAAHALESVRRFNPNALQADVIDLGHAHPELAGAFDFANLWGVAQHTHDPRAAFMNSAATVAPGGAFYLMVYSPEGLHATPRVNLLRKTFNQIDSADEQISFVLAVHRRRWHRRLPLSMNLKDAVRNALGRPRWGTPVGLLDIMMPWYNWTIPLEVAEGWMREAGFGTVTVLNAKSANRVAHHLLGSDKSGSAVE